MSAFEGKADMPYLHCTCPRSTQSGVGTKIAAASVAILDATQLARYSRFAQTPNYIDSDAPPVKFSLCFSFGMIVGRSCLAWH
jgi:hypothetical protein